MHGLGDGYLRSPVPGGGLTRPLHHLLSGYLPPIQYRLDSKPDSRPVIILLDAMWNDKPGPHSFECMAWMGWFPVGDAGGKLASASAEANIEVLSWPNDLKPKSRFIVFLEVWL